MTEHAWAVVRRDSYEHGIDWTIKEVCATRAGADAEVERLTAINGPIYEVHLARMRGFVREERYVWMAPDGTVKENVRGFNTKARRVVGPWQRVPDEEGRRDG
jgi:hypothetical protein